MMESKWTGMTNTLWFTVMSIVRNIHMLVTNIDLILIQLLSFIMEDKHSITCPGMFMHWNCRFFKFKFNSTYFDIISLAVRFDTLKVGENSKCHFVSCSSTSMCVHPNSFTRWFNEPYFSNIKSSALPQYWPKVFGFINVKH